MTPAEVAAELRVTPKTVREWCRLGQLHCIKVGRQWRVSRPALESFIKTRQNDPNDKDAPQLGPRLQLVA